MASAENLKIAQQLLATMQQITVQLEKQTETYRAQAELVDALCKAQECFGKIDANKVKEVSEALKEARDQTKEFGSGLEEAEKTTSFLGEKIKSLAEKVAKLSVPKEFVNGFRSGLNFAGNLFKNILSIGRTAFGLLKDIGGIFLSLPGRLMDFFQGAAGGGTDPYRQALEELRGEFGSLAVGTSKAVISMTKDMKGFTEKAGLPFSRVFGFGREGIANLLKENMELFKAMGPLANRLAASIRGSEAEFTILRKATGLSAEAFSSFQITAENAGQNTGDVIKKLGVEMVRAERTFGYSTKEIGKDINEMMKDTATFGVMAPNVMIKTSIYVKKLGISVETLKKVMEKSLNFEDAAQSAAKLSEAFNIQIDAMKLMNEQDPTKKLDMIRQAFFKTGQNIENMTVQQKAYLAQQTGMSDQEMRLAFSQKNRAMTGAQLDAQMKKSQKQQISQAEAMKQLADSIQRLVQSGSALKGGFLDMFMKGFETGIRRSREFRQVVYALQRSMRIVWQAGVEVGRLFVKEFPGVKKMLEALRQLFDPGTFRIMMRRVVNEFRQFFRMLQTDPKAGVENFMKNMKKIFLDWFNKGSPAGSKFLDGLKMFYKAVANIFAAGLRYALQAVADGMKTLAGFIRNPKQFLGGTTGAAAGAGSWIMSLLTPIWEAIRDSWPALKEAFLDLWDAAWPHIKSGLLTALKAIGPYLIGIIVGPAFLRGGAVAIAQGLLGSFTGGTSRALPGITNIFKAFNTRLSGTIPEGMREQGSRAGEAIQGAGEAAGAANRAVKTDWSGVAIKLALAALVITALTYLVLPKLIELAKIIQEEKIEPTKIIAAAIVLAGVAAAFTLIAYGVSALFKAASSINPGLIGNAWIGLAIVLVAAIAIGEFAILISAAFQYVKLTGIAKATLALGMAVGFLIGVSAIVLIATGIGALALSSFGISGGAMAAGLAILAAASLVIVDTVMAVMLVIDEFEPRPGFKEKSEAFVKILEGITSFATVYASISSSTQSSGIWDFFTGNGAERQQATLHALEDVIRTMGVQLTNIVREVVNAIQALQGSESQIKSAEIIGNVLGAIANLAKALQPPSEALQEPGIMDRLLGNPDEVSNKIAHVSRYVTTISVAVQGFLTTITNLITSSAISAGMTEAQQRAATTFVALLAGVGEFIKTITPTRALIEGLQGARDFSGALTNISKFMETNLRTITESNIFQKIGEIVTTIINSTSNLTDKQTDRLKAIIPIIEPLLKAIVSIANIISFLVVPPNTGAATTNAAALFQLNQVLVTLFNRLKDDLPTLITSIREAFQGLDTRQANAMAKGLEAVSRIFEVIASIPTMLNSLKGLSGGAQEASQFRYEDIGVLFNSLQALFGGYGGNAGLGFYIGWMVNTFKRIAATVRDPGDFSRKVNTIKTIFDVLNEIPPMIKGFKELGGAAAATGEVSADVMNIPLLNLRRVIESLGSKLLTTGALNPLVDTEVWEKLTFVQTNMKGKKAIFDRVKAQLTGVFTAAQEITALPEIQSARIDSLNTNLNNIDTLITTLHDKLGPDKTGRWSSNITEVTTGIGTHLIHNVHDMVEAYNTFARELQNVGSGTRPIQVAIDNLGTRLGGQARQVVRNAAVNATINVHVTMDAGDVVAALKTQAQQRNQTGGGETALALTAFNPVATAPTP